MLNKVLDKNLFYEEFKKLKSKVKKDKNLLYKAEVNSAITLGWVIHNQDLVIDELMKSIKQGLYDTPTAVEKEVLIKNKKRLLYGFDWHEKVLQAVVSRVLSDYFETVYSESLSSYRKGRGSFLVLSKVSSFLSKINNKDNIFIIKKDIKSYGDNIDHELLFEMLSAFIKDKTLMELIKKIIRFNYVEFGTKAIKVKDKGMPTGSPINNIMVNLFLSDLDKKIESLSADDLCYFRYGDDIFIASQNKSLIQKAEAVLNRYISQKNLEFNDEKSVEWVINDIFRSKKFKYLGLMVGLDGVITPTPEKDEQIKQEIKDLLKKVLVMNRTLKLSKKEKVLSLIRATRESLFRTDLFCDLSSYFLVINDERYWKELDLWIAKTILRLVYKTGSDKNFGKFSYQDLRKTGLPSIVHSRRLYLRDGLKFKTYAY